MATFQKHIKKAIAKYLCYCYGYTRKYIPHLYVRKTRFLLKSSQFLKQPHHTLVLVPEIVNLHAACSTNILLLSLLRHCLR